MTAVDEPRGPRVLQFEPFTSCLDAGFWTILTRKKLEDYGLDESEKRLWGYYSIDNAADLPCLMNVDHDAVSANPSIPPRKYPIHGSMIIYNTIEKFRDSDKQKIADGYASEIWAAILSGEALENPGAVNRMLLLCFMDLKKYHYSYWFLFPALVYPDKWVHESDPLPIRQVFSDEDVDHILAFIDAKPPSQNAFLIVTSGPFSVLSLKNLPEIVANNEQFVFGICDASVRPDNPGWTARNLMAVLAYHIRGIATYKRIRVLCYRDRFRSGRRDIDHSVVFDLRVVFTPNQVSDSISCPKAVGWEKNEKGKLGPRVVNLSGQMDPKKLAEQAVDLNLKLMRWRLVPELDLPSIGAARCLILGSGTLGCNVARCLMGWGVKHLTFVDSAKVSFSNPVRQSLFTFDDCLDGGKPKAQAAADAMHRIFPGVNAAAHQMNIPMPGHSVSDHLQPKVAETIHLLETLIHQHDVIFLLMDTRESRWLPTVIGASKRKIIINAALGFDSYLVMRHGMLPASGSGSPDGSTPHPPRLGCYFCNDVVAPGNSTHDRTLDQQCTVTRPGVSVIASALAVELLVTLLQHPQGAFAPPDSSAHDNQTPSPLGLVPHQIRGYLSRHNTILPFSWAFDKCTACSIDVINEYEKSGNEFLFKVVNNPPKFLEDFTGLTKLHEESEKAEVWDLSDDESIPSTGDN